MKHVLSVVFLLFFISLSAQMGPCSLVGDNGAKELYYKIDEIPDIFSLGIKGDNNQWLFSGLQAPRSYTYKLSEASTGKYSIHFKDAEMVLKEPLGREVYYMTRSDKWYAIGEASLKAGSILPEVILYDIPLNACPPTSRSKPRVTGTKYKVDSVESSINLREVKDASGVLYLPDDIYDVERIEKTETFTSGGVVTTKTSYVFVDQQTGDFLMEAETDDDGQLKKVIYKSKEMAGSQRISGGDGSLRSDFLLYPNKGFGEVRLDFKNFTRGRYMLVVKNIVGKKIWMNTYDIDGDNILKEDLTFLPRAVYTYSLLDSDQNVIVTRRLAIIKS